MAKVRRALMADPWFLRGSRSGFAVASIQNENTLPGARWLQRWRCSNFPALTRLCGLRYFAEQQVQGAFLERATALA